MFLRDLQAIGRPATTQRSYALALLRWFRFLWTVEVAWDQATRAEARDFCCWMQVAARPDRLHWRDEGAASLPPGSVRPVADALVHRMRCSADRCPAEGIRWRRSRTARRCCGPSTTSTWSATPGCWSIPSPWSAARRAASERPPQPEGTTTSSALACTGPRSPKRIPRRIPDEKYTEVFAGLPLAPGPCPGGVLGRHRRPRRGAAHGPSGRCGPGQQLITVIRKGTRAFQELPATPDAFVWLRLYQEESLEGCRAAARSRCGGRCAARCGR